MLIKKDENYVSGINIEEAKKFLANEQEYDKKLYRDRIKRMHAVSPQKLIAFES